MSQKLKTETKNESELEGSKPILAKALESSGNYNENVKIISHDHH